MVQTVTATLLLLLEYRLQLSARSDLWMMDGNLVIALPKFKQFCDIHVPLRDTAVSIVYAFLQHKTQSIYEELFKAVLEK